ncbi:MAG: pyrroline-5-carboxylate reductase [Roseovarius sp.]
MTAVGFLGTGHIAAPMARALARDGHSVTVSRRNETVSTALAGAGLGIAVADNQGVVDAAQVVFLCLRPAVWREALAALRFRADQQIVSVMAGVALADIAAQVRPARDISATIPYGFIEHGGCPLPVAGDPGALAHLFGARNPILPQPDEGALRHHFAASTLVTAVLAVLETGAAWLAEKTADPASAEIYVANLVAGVLAGLDRDRAGELAAERAALATEGTLSLQMHAGLAQGGALDLLARTLESISARLGAGK